MAYLTSGKRSKTFLEKDVWSRETESALKNFELTWGRKLLG
jgi:hypothetical protein